MDSDRREHPRIPTRLSVRFVSPKAFLQQYASNISKGGLFVAARNPPPQDSEIEIVLHFPFTDRSIQAKARVVYVPVGADGKPAGMGVQFLGLTGEQTQAIEDYVASHTPAAGKRAAG